MEIKGGQAVSKQPKDEEGIDGNRSASGQYALKDGKGNGEGDKLTTLQRNLTQLNEAELMELLADLLISLALKH